MLKRTIFAAVALVGFTGLAIAGPSPVGTWNGKLDTSGMKLPTPKTDAEKKQIQMGVAMMAKVKIVIIFKADKTYTATMTNPNGQKSTNGGTWSQEGMTVKTKGKNGNATTLAMSADGKRMTATPPANQGTPPGLKVVLVKA